MTRERLYVLILPLVLATVPVIVPAVQPGAAWAGAAPTRLGDLLDEIPAERLKTGILYDRVLSLSRIENHDGSARPVPASLSEWRQMYDEIYRASLAAPSWPDVAAVFRRGRAPADDAAIPIAVMDFLYERIREDALETGALVDRDGRLVFGDGDPFVTRRVFAAAPMQDWTYRGYEVVFRLDRVAYVTNRAASPERVEIDFDDARGFVTVPFDRAVPVRYATTGRKTVRLRVTLTDGATLHAAFPFSVASLVTPPPHDTLHVAATIPYQGQTQSGDAYVYLAPSHAALTNPVVVVEGFDLDNSMNWDELYAGLNQEQLLETLRGRGFDFVVLNFADATDYLQRNAYVVVELIQQVKAAIRPQSTICLVGASMGGVAARFALAYMESQALPHRVRTLVSFDAPQNGANLPLGIQYWLAFFADESPDAAALLAALDSPAARQILVYHHTEPPSATGTSDPLRGVFESDLAVLGDYPVVPRKVAIANGSGARVGQGFAPGEQIVRWEYGDCCIEIRGNVWAVPDNTSQTIFHGLIDPIFFPPDARTVTVSGTRPFDNAPGGSWASMADMDSVAAPWGDIVALHDRHCVIPTVSALDIDTGDLFYYIAGDPNILVRTPFDAVYFPVANQEHVMITAQNAGWVIAEVEAGVTAVAGPPLAGAAAAAVRAVPNPFHEETRIHFTLPRPGPVRLGMYDASGRKVAVVLDGHREAGEHTVVWRGTDVSGRRVSAGTYLARVAAKDVTRSCKVLLR